MSDFGSDVQTFPDLDPAFAPLTGGRVLLEGLCKRLQTPRGSLEWAPDYGTDLRALLNAGMTQGQVDALKAAVETEALKDERVLAASATCTFDFATQVLTVSLAVSTAEGPFTLTLAVTAVTVDAISAR